MCVYYIKNIQKHADLVKTNVVCTSLSYAWVRAEQNGASRSLSNMISLTMLQLPH